MDPEETLNRASRAYEASDQLALISALQEYWALRDRGGCEPEMGDRHARWLEEQWHRDESAAYARLCNWLGQDEL